MSSKDRERQRASEARYRKSELGRATRSAYDREQRAINPEYKERRNVAVAKWVEKNPNYHRNWKVQNAERRLLYSAQSSAKQRECECSITLEDIVIPDVCPVLGIPLDRSAERLAPNKPSIDRIDNAKGYVPGNVQVISWRANRLKADASLEELVALGKAAAKALKRARGKA